MQSPQMRGQGKASLVVDKVQAMKRQERSPYLYRRYVKPPSTDSLRQDPEDIGIWREKICHWTYSVIDHFELSRNTVAISIDLFDRYLATLGNRCDGSLALLISLTTLYIAIKVHEKKKIKLSTLTELSRSQFKAEDIEEMEVKVLQSLSWFVHPPTALDFISHLIKFLPPSVSMPVRHNIFELSRYMAELSVCDPFFIEHHASTIAFASIINVLEGEISYDNVSMSCRASFFRCLHEELNFLRGRSAVRYARDRLQTMVAASGVVYGLNKEKTSSRLPQQTVRRSRSDEHNMHTASTTGDSIDSRMSKSPRSRCNSAESRNSSDSRGSEYMRLFRSHRRKSLVTPC